jgi:hypothetical protein
MRCECERPNRPGGVQIGSQRIFVLYSAKTTWIRVFPDRCGYEPRVQEPVDRAPAPVTVEDELAILAKCLVPDGRQVRYGGLPLRIHAALPRMRVTVMTIPDVVPPRDARTPP